ncbi:MAG: adenine deaminase [Deltaproteobacteria bacterium]|nr:adenine deaminase [Deltaproteobacteria bacterium]
MNEPVKTVAGNIVDVLNQSIYPGEIKIANGKIIAIIQNNENYATAIIPGFVDAHIHIESSMLPPSEFARVAAVHGTVATVSDPHEIANVLGESGVTYMINNAQTVPLKFYFGAPSCVPATTLETSGASLGPEEVDSLLQRKDIYYLAEVMNYPGVLNGDPNLIKKINCARKYGKPVDGHAPGLRGKELEQYVRAGISTDHECLTIDEAKEKISLGMKIHIREGSAAKNFETFIPLANEHYAQCMFCSDDKHPDDLVTGHVNLLVKRALAHGLDIMKVLTIATVNPVLHYGLDVGLLRVGDDADFLEIDNLDDLTILKTYIKGNVVARHGESFIPKTEPGIVNNFPVGRKASTDFMLPYQIGDIQVIEAIDGNLITNRLRMTPRVADGVVQSDGERDILKITVVNRYQEAPPAIGFIKNFGLKQGAIASSVAHDSHNIIAVGVTDTDISTAVNAIIENRGGICAARNDTLTVLPLPIAGIMSDQPYATVAETYTALDGIAKSLGSPLHAPFMTLSFMALPVIPALKLSDRGLFDGEKFEFISVFEK